MLKCTSVKIGMCPHYNGMDLWELQIVIAGEGGREQKTVVLSAPEFEIYFDQIWECAGHELKEYMKRKYSDSITERDA